MALMDVFTHFSIVRRERRGIRPEEIKPEEDNVRFYWLSKDATSKTLTIGSKHPEPPPQYYVI
jgi:hypothetical protein